MGELLQCSGAGLSSRAGDAKLCGQDGVLSASLCLASHYLKHDLGSGQCNICH